MRKRNLHKIIGLWSEAGQMMLDSAQVIAHRTQRMAKPGHTAADRREFARMVHEKMEAGVESALVLSRAMVVPQSLPGVLGQAMKPFAKRARANARRLCKIKG